jgi:hypothetical protein
MILGAVSTPQGYVWQSSLTGGLGNNLPIILNQLGAQGWEVVTVGDVTGDGRPDIILKKQA